MNFTLKAFGDEAYGFNHRYYGRDDSVLKGRSKKGKMAKNNELYLGIPPSLQDGRGMDDLPVVETTGFITLSLWDKE